MVTTAAALPENPPLDNGKGASITSQHFDNLGGKFIARLREIAANTRTSADGKGTITFKTARVEAMYSPEIIKKIEAGRLVAIPNVLSVGTHDSYSIYEVADVYPMHYSMLTLDRSQPGAIRKEFMTMIEKEWQTGSKSTWIEIVAAPTGYVMQIVDENNENVNKNGSPTKDAKFIRKNAAPLAGSQVYLLSKETIQKFICYAPKDYSSISTKNLQDYTIGHLLGLTDSQVPFSVSIEKLLHYHVGVFAFTGSGKSNFTSLVIRKAINNNTVPNAKFVIFDVSSEYGINILDVLRSQPTRVVFTDDLRGKSTAEKAEDYLRRHVVPEALADKKDMLLVSIEELLVKEKIRAISIESEAEQTLQGLATYGGLLGALADMGGEKFGSAGQKMLIPTIAALVRKFMRENKINDEESTMGKETLPLLTDIDALMAKAKLAANSSLISFFANLKLALENQVSKDKQAYDTDKLVSEIMSESPNSPRVFVINLPEADVARVFCAEVINRVFRYRKNSFTLNPKIIFVFDEAQEFIPQEKKREDGTEVSSKAVERLLRHGRKYFLHGWISTQRIAHLNTNALQQLHSYFVSTMPRPYDRQLISDSFAIDDAFMERTLMFQNGDWLMTSFKATNTQSVPVFFHAINNEESILD
jgi:DNA helicase HerA-like ATPase